MPVLIEVNLPVMCTLMQVFEYLTTDLKKYMDKNGKGPNFPLPKTTVKVCYQTDNICLARTALSLYLDANLYQPFPWTPITVAYTVSKS